MQSVFNVVGYTLLILGLLSGGALFARAVLGSEVKDIKDEESRRKTLWGLFIVSVVAGLVLIAVAQPVSTTPHSSIPPTRQIPLSTLGMTHSAVDYAA